MTDGYIVSRINGANSLYGIFKVEASDPPSEWYCETNAKDVWTHPVAAILQAHRINDSEYTEYGVYVHSLVLKDAENYYRPEGWRKENVA